MSLQSINPVTNTVFNEMDSWDESQLETTLAEVAAATPAWNSSSIEQRASLMVKAGQVLRDNSKEFSKIISQEMGKLLSEAEAEIEKSASVCDYYAENAASFLKDEIIETDASKSYVTYLPLGTILAVMPWNYPIWQVLRFAATSLMGGNTAVLKHASNVPLCAMICEQVFIKAGFPDNVFRTLLISSRLVEGIIADDRINGVALTGSEAAGRQVAASAGKYLKKSVMELGGSDAFIVLADANIDDAVAIAIKSRFMNAGQACSCSKRFILIESIADEFLVKFKNATEALKIGDPADPETTLAPMARIDLRNELHDQVERSVAAGAQIIIGGEPVEGPGAYYQATILSDIDKNNPAYSEEFFGPVALTFRVKDEEEAIHIANDSPYGLSNTIMSGDVEHANEIALKVESGLSFINGMSGSNIRLPFGGIKASGYGRELSYHGIREFTNTKSIWIK